MHQHNSRLVSGCSVKKPIRETVGYRRASERGEFRLHRALNTRRETPITVASCVPCTVRLFDVSDVSNGFVRSPMPSLALRTGCDRGVDFIGPKRTTA